MTRRINIFDHILIYKNICVRHEVEGAVWGDEGDTAVLVELAQPDALVKLQIWDIDAAVDLAVLLLLLHEELVVHAELALGHVGQLALDSHLALDLYPQNRACQLKQQTSNTLVWEQSVDMLDDVDVDLVALVLDALGSPAGDSRGLLSQLFQLLDVVHGLGL